MDRPNCGYFLKMEDFKDLSPEMIEIFTGKYEITFEKIDKSNFAPMFYSITGNPIRPGIIDYGKQDFVELKDYDTDDEEDAVKRVLKTDDDQHAVFTFKYIAEEDAASIEVVLDRMSSPKLRTIDFYDGDCVYCPEDSIVMAHQMSVKTRPMAMFDTTVGRAIYIFPELTCLQEDYIDDLFTSLVQTVIDEQEETSNEDLRRGLMPKSNLINKFVTKMSMEVFNGQRYLVIFYENNAKKRVDINGKIEVDEVNDDIPAQLEIFSDVQYDDEDQGDTDECALDSDGNRVVRYELTLYVCKLQHS